MEATDLDPSYIDYEAFTDPDFSPTAFANTLIHATNNASDTVLDLDTPLSRVLFDLQDIDTRIDTLTAKSALPLLNHTKDDVQAGSRILSELETQLATLNESYARLHKEVIVRHEAAQEARVAAERLWRTVNLGRYVGRCLTLGRQLEAQISEAGAEGAGSTGRREDYGAMVRSANSILSLRQILNIAGPGGEAEGLERITVIRTLQSELIEPAEERSVARAEQIVGQFSMSALTASQSQIDSTTTASGTSTNDRMTRPQTEDIRSRATSALLTLYLLSPIAHPQYSETVFAPTRLISALQEYLRRAITASISSLAAALAALPRLERTLLEISARCQNIVALEILLSSLNPPDHPLITTATTTSTPPNPTDNAVTTNPRAPANLLTPLLISLDTPSLPSYFWRTLASQLSTRTARIVKDGGVSARTLKSNRDRVRDAIRECVGRGSRLPDSVIGLGMGGAAAGTGNGRGEQGKEGMMRGWEREAAVMIGSLTNVLGR